MRQKRLQQSKSKSQTLRILLPCTCGHSQHAHDWPHPDSACIGWKHGSTTPCPCLKFTLAKPRKPPQDALSEPEAPLTAAEFVLTPNRNSGRWMVSFDLGSHHYEYASNFYASDSPDPLIKHLRQQTNGELKVIVNL